MGLDMNLYRDKIVQNWQGDEKKNVVELNGVEIKDVHSIRMDVKYWRKANQVHKFFQDKCADDTQSDFYVGADVIQELHSICNKICEHVTWTMQKGHVADIDTEVHSSKLKWKKIAEELLPTQSGFFFGSTDYDEWYLHDVIDTKLALDKLMEDKHWDLDTYYYSASW